MNQQQTLFDLPSPPPRQPYGDVPHARGSDTSAAAAETIKPKRHELQETVLQFVRSAGDEGLTAEEAGAMLADQRGNPDRYDYAVRSTAAARLCELKQLGRVRDSGRRRRNRSGATAAVFIASGIPSTAQENAPADRPEVL